MSVATDALVIVRALCIRFEGVFLRPYYCPAHVATIGIGSTAYEDGTKVAITDPVIPLERAYSLLDMTLAAVYLPAVRRYCPPSVVNANLQAGLGDFAYNLGVTRLKASTLLRKVNAGDMAGARREMLKWVRGGGKVLPGLVVRRQADAKLL